jgi:hypothetical protein
MRMHGIPASWGFIRDLKECVGKTIERVENVSLGFGYTIDSAWAVRFTDGSRAFFGNRPSGGVSWFPSEDAMAKSEIFKPEELGEVVAERMREDQQRKRDAEARERREFEALKKKFSSPQS